MSSEICFGGLVALGAMMAAAVLLARRTVSVEAVR
jgi:hypothetical protein